MTSEEEIILTHFNRHRGRKIYINKNIEVSEDFEKYVGELIRTNAVEGILLDCNRHDVSIKSLVKYIEMYNECQNYMARESKGYFMKGSGEEGQLVFLKEEIDEKGILNVERLVKTI